ncbi:MAG TPA: tRNA guanosine(34) transglycosylase Tgt [Bacteroidales bacterium]|nr:tRNA guanosine(34) transglycosylase Tgt [Bacteroidales bacterium]
MNFLIIHQDKDTKARSGKITTDHGVIETPVFMPVGTAGSVKAVHQKELVEDVGAEIILGNTYHLYLRPGTEIIRQAGGLHQFMNWDLPLLTDSGGYQVFSLAGNRKITEEGAIFSSHIDGSKHTFTPESVVDIQRMIGADITMALDECTPYPCEYQYAKSSMELTHRWLERGIRRFQETSPLYNHQQDLFPIVQGSVYKDLRKQSAEVISSHHLPGNAIGGLSVGEPPEKMYEMIEIVTDILPLDKPRYLMGVGTPENILEAVSQGIDMFDCVIPTRNGRNGMLFTSEGIINIKNKKWSDDFSMIDKNGTSFVDTQYSKAYLRHLVTSGEILGAQIATLHNLGFYMWLLKESGKKIREGAFGVWKKKMIKKLSGRI